MSTRANAQRPNLSSYISFASSSFPRRRTSVTLSKDTAVSDPFEKPGRCSRDPQKRDMGLVNDVKVNWHNQSKRSRSVKTGVVVAFMLTVLYLLAPGTTRVSRQWQGGDVASDPSMATKKCTRSYSPSKPLVQYALMIDAGSTGSRIHVYRFNNCGPTPELEEEIFEQTAKRERGSGLSSYGSDAEGAAKSLDVLLAVATKHVPDKIKKCTPIAVKATAGLRKLGEEKSNRILAAVRSRLEKDFPFPVVAEDQHGVEVMDGKDEGVYAWITTNYLLGKIGGPDKSPTAAVFDLGGGSTQIVFQPTFPGAPEGGVPEELAEGDHKYNLSFGGRDFTLYQHSYLGYGLMEARNHLHVKVINAMLKDHPTDQSRTKAPIANPCFPPGMNKTIKVELPAGHELGSSIDVTMVGPHTTSPAQCRGLAEKLLLKDSPCELAPCAFNGIHQPSLSKTFSREDIYLFSYFYDRTAPLGMPESFTLNELKDLTSKVCAGEQSGNWDSFKAIEGALDELRGRPEWCLDLNFITALLHTGYEMPMDREVKIAKKIKGNELGWCLGASLPLLSKDSGWTCKVQEIGS